MSAFPSHRAAGVFMLLLMTTLLLASVSRAEVPTVLLTNDTVKNILEEAASQDNRIGQGGQVQYDLILQNGTDRPGIWRLKTELLRPVAFEVRAGADDRIIFQSDQTYLRQPTRASQGPEIVSEPIILDPGVRVALQMVFDHPPGEDMFPISVMPAQAYTAEMRQERMVHGIYFGAQILFVVFFLVFSHVLSSRPAQRFALYLVGLTVLNAHSHGYTSALTELLGLPFFPLIRVLQVAVMLAYLSFAMTFLTGQRAYPKLTLYMRIYFVVFAAGLTVEMVFGTPFLSMLAGATFLLAAIGTAYIAMRDRLDGSWYFTAGFVTLLVVGVVNFFASNIRDPAANDLVDALTLFLQLCDAGIFAGAIVAQTRGLRRARDEAREAQLAEYQARLALNERLEASRIETQRVRALAEQHRSRLATTSHDLRQPLASLRISLERARELAPELARDLSSGIDFLDTVLGEALDDTRPDPEAPRAKDNAEAVPLQLVFDNAARMFGAEAAAKGLDLRVVSTGVVVEIAAIDLIRIVSNLVANAVKYTDTGSVLVGVRRRGGTADIDVWDTGPGIPPDRMDTILQPYDRAGRVGPDGEGLGLSIARDLAERHVCTIDVRSVPGKGSCFSLRGMRPV